jgi:hypothetical protein
MNLPMSGDDSSRPAHLRDWPTLLAAIAFLAGAAYVYHIGSPGFNKRVYECFAQRYFEGVDLYAAAPSADFVKNPWCDPSWLDVTGLGLSFYIGVGWIARNVHLNALTLYSLLQFAGVLLLLRAIRAARTISELQYRWTLLLVLAPPTWFFLYRASYEDKMQFPLAVLLVLWLHPRRPALAAATVGIMTAWVGAPALLFPLILCDAVRDVAPARRFRAALPLVLASAAAFAIGMIPFFPRSLGGWHRRSLLEAGMPRWWSAWQLVRSWYVPHMNHVAILLAVGVLVTLYYRRRIALETAATGILAAFFAFAADSGPQRIVPLVMLLPLAAREPRTLRWSAPLVLLIELSWVAGVHWYGALQDYPAGDWNAVRDTLWMNAPWAVFALAAVLAVRLEGSRAKG